MTNLSKKITLDVMAKQDTSGIKINLSIRRESFAKVFLKWSVQTGRVIIILTELIAVSALFYRFIIDRQIIDLHDQIRNELIIVRAQEQKELEYRKIQKKLASVKSITEDTKAKIQTQNSIAPEISKEGISVNQFNLVNNEITLDGRSSSIYNFNEFITNLKKTDYISSIFIRHISGSKQGIDFNITITLKTKS